MQKFNTNYFDVIQYILPLVSLSDQWVLQQHSYKKKKEKKGDFRSIVYSMLHVNITALSDIKHLCIMLLTGCCLTSQSTVQARPHNHHSSTKV